MCTLCLGSWAYAWIGWDRVIVCIFTSVQSWPGGSTCSGFSGHPMDSGGLDQPAGRGLTASESLRNHPIGEAFSAPSAGLLTAALGGPQQHQDGQHQGDQDQGNGGGGGCCHWFGRRLAVEEVERTQEPGLMCDWKTSVTYPCT